MSILTGPDPTTRLERMGAKVTGRTVTLDHKPGYAGAVLLRLWQQHGHLPANGGVEGPTARRR